MSIGLRQTKVCAGSSLILRRKQATARATLCKDLSSMIRVNEQAFERSTRFTKIPPALSGAGPKAGSFVSIKSMVSGPFLL